MIRQGSETPGSRSGSGDARSCLSNDIMVEYAGGFGEDNAVVAISSRVFDHLRGNTSAELNSILESYAQLVLPTVDYGTG
jgi:hypothetical protein